MTIPTIAALAALLAAATVQAQAQDTPWVTETAGEFFAHLAAAGQQPERFVVVDKATGVARWATLGAGGTFTPSVPRSSGVRNVTGGAVGRPLGADPPTVALASPEANSISAVSAAPAAETRTVYLPDSIGPGALTALESPLPGADATRAEWLVASEFNGGATPHLLALTTADGAALAWAPEAATAYGAAHTFRLETTGPEVAGLLAGEVFSAWRADTAPLIPALTGGGIAVGSQWVAGFFNPAKTRPGLVFYKPGQSTLSFRQVTGDLTLGPAVDFALGEPIDAVTVAGKWLIVVSGGTAHRYDFDGLNSPVPRQTYTAPDSETFTAAAGRSDNGLLLLSGPAGRSARWQTLEFNGATHSPAASGALPAIPSATTRGSQVFVFSADPFLSPDTSGLVALGGAPDWTTAALGGLSFLAETDRGPGLGLGVPAAVTAVLAAPPAGQPLLVNQIAADISLFSFAGRESAGRTGIQLDPAPGAYRDAVYVSLRVSGRPSPPPIYFQLGDDQPWLPYSAPVPLMETATLRAYAQVGTTRTPIAGGLYTLADNGPLTPAPDRPAEWTDVFGPEEKDPDRDKVPNGGERSDGTDPNDGTDVRFRPFTPPALLLLGVDPPPASRLRLRLQGPPGFLHAVESSASLGQGSWEALIAPFVMPTSGFHDFSAPVNPAALRFFRGVVFE